MNIEKYFRPTALAHYHLNSDDSYVAARPGSNGLITVLCGLLIIAVVGGIHVASNFPKRISVNIRCDSETMAAVDITGGATSLRLLDNPGRVIALHDGGVSDRRVQNMTDANFLCSKQKRSVWVAHTAIVER